MFQHKVELRANGDNSRHIYGVAAKVNSPSNLIYGEFREIIEKGAFDGADMSDVICVRNHNIDMILARTIANTLTVSINDDGDLVYEFDAPDTTVGNDLLEDVRNGNIQHSSFRFIAEDWKWETDEDGHEVRRITRFKKIIDVAPVINAAYPETSVDARSMDMLTASLQEYRNQKNPPSDIISAEVRQLELKIKRERFKF